jgi:hypothetical protein
MVPSLFGSLATFVGDNGILHRAAGEFTIENSD